MDTRRMPRDPRARARAGAACCSLALALLAGCSEADPEAADPSDTPSAVEGRWLLTSAPPQLYPALHSGEMSLGASGTGTATLVHQCTDAVFDWDYSATWSTATDARFTVDLACLTPGPGSCCYSRLLLDCALSASEAELVCTYVPYEDVLEWKR